MLKDPNINYKNPNNSYLKNENVKYRNINSQSDNNKINYIQKLNKNSKTKYETILAKKYKCCEDCECICDCNIM